MTAVTGGRDRGRWCAENPSACGIGAECQRRRTEPVNHPADRARHIAEEHGCPYPPFARIPAGARLRQSPEQNISSQKTPAKRSKWKAVPNCSRNAMSSSRKDRPSIDQPAGNAGGLVQYIHIHRPLPDQATEHGASGHAPERHEASRPQIQQGQKRTMPQADGRVRPASNIRAPRDD